MEWNKYVKGTEITRRDFLKDTAADAVTAPSCLTCHGDHHLKTMEEIQDTCVRCHSPLSGNCQAKSATEVETVSVVCEECHSRHSAVTKSR